jgi:hypothetical protein
LIICVSRNGLFLSVLYPTGLSLSSHKEFRFLLPALPFCHIACACVLDYYKNSKQKKNSYLEVNAYKLCNLYLGSVAVAHMGALAYFSVYHQAGPETSYRKIIEILTTSLSKFSSGNNTTSLVSVLLLAPCHAFPGYAFLPVMKPISECDGGGDSGPTGAQRWIAVGMDKGNKENNCVSFKLYFPDCSPDVVGITESREFEMSPVNFFNNVTKRSKSGGHLDWDLVSDPDVIVTFDGYYDQELEPVLSERGYSIMHSYHHAHVRYDMDDPVSKKRVFVLMKKKSSSY